MGSELSPREPARQDEEAPLWGCVSIKSTLQTSLTPFFKQSQSSNSRKPRREDLAIYPRVLRRLRWQRYHLPQHQRVLPLPLLFFATSPFLRPHRLTPSGVYPR